MHTALAKRLDVCLRGGCQPHVGVHRGGNNNGRIRGENRQRHHVVSKTRREAREGIRGRRNNDDQVRDTSELHVLGSPLPRVSTATGRD